MTRIEIVWNIQNIIAVLFAIVGCVLLVASFIVPPVGVIDSSIEFILGEIFAFISACLGIDSYYRQRYREGKNQEKNQSEKS